MKWQKLLEWLRNREYKDGDRDGRFYHDLMKKIEELRGEDSHE